MAPHGPQERGRHRLRPPPAGPPRRRRSGWLPLLTVILLGTFAGPAVAHPFGPPPVAEIRARGDTVYVSWTADVDDVVVVAVEAGVLPERAIEDFEDGAPSELPEAYDTNVLAHDPVFHDHLVAAISVVQHGEPCAGEVTEADEVLREGVRLEYRCPETVEVVDVGIDLLHGLHPAYRTYTTARGQVEPTQTVLNAEQPVQRYTFGDGAPAASDSPDAGALDAAAVGAAAALIVGGGLVWRRRRMR